MKKLFILLTISLLIINAGCNKIPEQEETQNQNENTATDNDNKQETVKIYFVALEDAGKSGEKIGCDDSLIAVDTQIEASQRNEDKITKSLEKLFAVKEKQYGQSGLYNALADATLKVEKLEKSLGKQIAALQKSIILKIAQLLHEQKSVGKVSKDYTMLNPALGKVIIEI